MLNNDLLNEYINDTNDPIINYKLGCAYEDIGQTAAGISYYLRAAERTDDDLLAYECLIHIGDCFKKQGNRNYTVKSMYNAAITLLPNRPEAYYLLSVQLENEKQYFESYMMAELGLKQEPVTSKIAVNYPGSWALLLQKALAAWWRGKGVESRKLFQTLRDEYWDQIDIVHKQNIEKNIIMLGSGPDSYIFRMYTDDSYSKLRYKFPGAKKIKRNYAQVFQDMFILSILDGKKAGTFLEIGGSDPYHGNNTFLLEQDFTWKGVSIELEEKFVKAYRTARPSTTVIHQDALTVDYREVLQKNFQEKIVDYLQLDIEPAKNTYECMLRIPFDEYKFRVITFEHDYYGDMSRTYRDLSREFLQKHGYVLVANDISPDGVCSFEDWWVHPDLVPQHTLKRMMDVREGAKDVTEYMLSHEEVMNYYEEFRTDQYIRETFFPDTDYKGVMVEVGAGPPQFISMSKHFRETGWRAICVDPNPKFAEQHRKDNSEIYEYACAADEGKAEFTINLNNDQWYTQENDGVSFSSLGIRYSNVPSHNTQTKIEVEKIRLNTLLERLSVDKIDFLSIDTEGWELDVLQGFDHDKYKPKVIVLENFENTNTYEKFMKERGYRRAKVISHNEIYVREEKIEMPFVGKVNVSLAKRAFVVDNFYSNPDEIRAFAQKQEYVDGGIGRGFIGKRTYQQFLFPGLKESFESILGMKITAWQEHGMNGRFQLNTSGEPIVYHCDSQKYAAMIYLTPNAPPEGGTSTFMHRKMRIHHNSHPEIMSCFNMKTFLDKTPFETVDKFGNIYNRLVIFDSGCIHGASEYFGSDFEDGRLWHMFFFDAE